MVAAHQPPAAQPPPTAGPSPAFVPAPAPMPAAAPAAAPAIADAARALQQTQRGAFAAERAAMSGAMRVAPLPEAPWMAALAEGLAVQWRLDGVPRPSPSSWLYALGAQAQGRWVPSAPTPAAGERSIQWQQGDVVLGRLWLNAERVLACDAQSRCQQAVLAPDVAGELLKSMPR